MQPGRDRSPELPAAPNSGFAGRRRPARDGVWRYRRLIVVLTAVGTAAAFLVSRFMGPEYGAEATSPIEMAGLQLTALGFIVSLGLSTLGAVMKGRKVRDPDQVTDGLGLPLLGTVPHDAAGDSQVGVECSSDLVEAFRFIRLSLMHAHGEAGPVVVAVTSPSTQEGKSFVTANLALSFAALGRRALVIDAEIGRGVMHQLFGGRRKPGFTDYLAGSARLDQVIHPTSHRKLERIGCGMHRDAAPHLLRPQTMAALLDELRPLYDVILIDTSLLAVGIDPLGIARLSGNLIVVLRSGVTDRELAASKLGMLESSPARVLGAVLNDVPAKRAYRGYRYDTAAYETVEDEPASVWHDVNGGEAVAAESVTHTDRPRPGKVYLPSGNSGGNGDHPTVAEEAAEEAAGVEPLEARAEPEALAPPAEATGLAEPAGPVEPTPPVEPSEPALPRAAAAQDAPAPILDEGDIWYQAEWDLSYKPDWEVRAGTELCEDPATRAPGKGNGGGAAPKPAEQAPPLEGDLPFSLGNVISESKTPGGNGGNGGSGERREQLLDAHAAAQVEKFRQHQRRHHQRLWK